MPLVHLRPRSHISGAIPVTPITAKKTDVSLICSPVCVWGTHRSSPQTLSSLSDICPDFEWHQSQSSVTLILSRRQLRWTDGGWPIYTPVTWYRTHPLARNIKLTAAYSEMQLPGSLQTLRVVCFLFLPHLDKFTSFVPSILGSYVPVRHSSSCSGLIISSLIPFLIHPFKSWWLTYTTDFPPSSSKRRNTPCVL